MQPVYCRDCDHVHSATRPMEPWKWRCLKAPTKPGYGFVDPQYSPNPPYDLCSRRNTSGDCLGFAPRREPPKEV